jgi:hypothetical protein
MKKQQTINTTKLLNKGKLKVLPPWLWLQVELQLETKNLHN